MTKIRQVGTLFGHPIYVDDSVPDGDVRVEPAPAGDALAETAAFAQRVIEEVAENWMYRATLHAQWACFYCNAVVEWMGDEGDEPVCEHFPDCLHVAARKLQERGR